MKIKITSWLLGFFCLFATKSFGQFATQSLQIGGQTQIRELASDLQGNIIAAGSLRNLPSPIPKSIVGKFSPNGNLLWVGSQSGSGNLITESVAVDPAGNIYVIGRIALFSQTDSVQLVGGPVWATQANGPVWPAPANSIFLVKYSPNGNLLWAKVYGTAAGQTIYQIACNPSGEVIIIGHSNAGGLSFGNNVVADQGYFVTKVSSSGDGLWTKEIGASGGVADVVVDVNNNITITGTFANSLVIDNQVVTGSQTNQMFVAQLSASGTVQYIKTNTGTGATNSNNISTNSSGNVFVAGQISSGTAIFDSITLPDPNGNGIFVVCLSPVGTVLSAKTIATEPSWSSFFISDLITDNQGNHFVAGAFMGDPVFGSIPVPNPTPGVQSVYLSRLDPAGNAVWAIAGGDASNLDVPKSLALGQNEDLFIAGNSSGSSNQPFSLAGLTVSNAKGYIFKVNAGGQYNHIAGRIFYDMNSDGIYNTTDAAAPATVLHVGSQYYNAESNGYYNAFTDSGTHIVSVSAPPYYNAVPGNHQVTFAGYGNVSNTADFALQPVPGMQDLQITLTSLAPPRPGFVFPLQITYRNAGTTLLSGSVELPLNSQLSFLQSMPAPSSQSGDTLIWNIGNLQPNQTGNIQIYASLPATAILGSIIHQLASVSPLTGDLTPADNTDTDSAIVVGSYDPNDKQVNLTSLTPTQIQTQEWLEYTIRFQNTGTDTAFTVRLADTLSALLNIPTIEILASSHPNTWSIKGTGIMEFRFDNILLPDSNINEPASHGFVKYRIKPKTTLALGDVIENTAYIYFDFNMPIVTNTATTEVKLINSVATLERNPLHIYPNPNNGTFTLQCSNIWQQQVSAELRNVLGQIVWTQILPVENGKLNQVIRTSNLPKGVYYLQLKTENGSKVQKVVIE